MISKKVKFTGFEEKTEMAKGGVSCEEFTIKGGVFGFGGEKFLGKEGKGSPGSMESLLQDVVANVGVRSIHSQRHSPPGDRVGENWNGG